MRQESKNGGKDASWVLHSGEDMGGAHVMGTCVGLACGDCPHWHVESTQILRRHSVAGGGEGHRLENGDKTIQSVCIFHFLWWWPPVGGSWSNFTNF